MRVNRAGYLVTHPILSYFVYFTFFVFHLRLAPHRPHFVWQREFSVFSVFIGRDLNAVVVVVLIV